MPPGEPVADPVARARIAESAAEGVPEHVPREVRHDHDQDKSRHAPCAEVASERDPGACESRKIADDNRGEVNNKISQDSVLAREEAYIENDMTHAFPL